MAPNIEVRTNIGGDLLPRLHPGSPKRESRGYYINLIAEDEWAARAA